MRLHTSGAVLLLVPTYARRYESTIRRVAALTSFARVLALSSCHLGAMQATARCLVAMGKVRYNIWLILPFPAQ
jgi:hypothetical protein